MALKSIGLEENKIKFLHRITFKSISNLEYGNSQIRPVVTSAKEKSFKGLSQLMTGFKFAVLDLLLAKNIQFVVENNFDSVKKYFREF